MPTLNSEPSPNNTFTNRSDMYDDLPYEDAHYGLPSDGYQTSRKDHATTPPRAPASDRIHSTRSDKYHTDERTARHRERSRSRSPRRDGRGRYTDRDREGYRSPRGHSRSRSRSPYFGGPPNRNVILEGLPIDMTQEDVGRPISILADLHTTIQSHFIISVHRAESGILAKHRTGRSWPLFGL
ncbi:uncharacterized protein BP5553_06702 [Venustampulla echinocandica]|uniref:Uncharacterized protein n=1 Tax=Venustampulla echinocandica TaxID=2656787 RepID=A0A370TKN6_9HELO|nr:uncharacterized protein BP5553_06702 [Venustampulla echinocandica]RDL36090.1 hypothetical protein BP5553_06702 [Venustampulla echinocandica]